MMAHIGCDNQDAANLTKQFLTLYSTPADNSDSDIVDLPQRDATSGLRVSFQESLYRVDEEDTFQSRFAAGFRGDTFYTKFHEDNNVYDCSHIHFSKSSSMPKQPGVCVDIGAPRSVIGGRYLNMVLHCRNEKSIPRMEPANSSRFVYVAVKSLGLIEIDLEVPSPRRSIPVLIDIVPVDVPTLLGLDLLDSECLHADNVTGRLVHRIVLSHPVETLNLQDVWSAPLLRCDGHLYAEMRFSAHTFYTSQQLLRFHRQFAHPSASKLFNLLETAGLEAFDSKTLEQLEGIGARCEPCQRIGNALRRFRVSIGQKNVRFNARAYIDIMQRDGKPVWHFIDEATRFSAARFLPRISTDSIWDAIIMCW